MPRVLIPTDEPNFSLGLIEGYRNLGCEVESGTKVLKKRDESFDVIHFQWPEEYSNWSPPTPEELSEIDSDLEFWRGRATLVNTVHNLRPHSSHETSSIESALNHDLYSVFFKKCHLVTHFTNASRELVLREYPAAQGTHHLVHTPPNYEVSLKRQIERGQKRTRLRLGTNDFVVLMLGRLRSVEEIELLANGFVKAAIPNKKLLMAGKISLRPRSLWNKLFLLRWRIWLKWIGAVVDERYYPEEEISQLIDSSDVLVVPRIGEMHSGIIFVAMTFGRMVIAPDCGGNPECLANTRNLLYKTGDPGSFASALTQASLLDTEAIGRENAKMALEWNWRGTCSKCLVEIERLKYEGLI